MRIAERVWSEVNWRYFDPNFGGIDWANERAAFLSLSAGNLTSDEFYRQINALIARLRDPHTFVSSPSQLAFERQAASMTFGLSVDPDGLIRRVSAGGPAAKAGIVPGTRIVAIDGETFGVRLDRYLRNMFPWVTTPSLSQTRYQRRIAASRMLSPIGSSSVRLSMSDGGEILVSAAVVQVTDRIESRRQPSGALLIAFDHFRARERGLVRTLIQQGDARGVIIDLRENGGGDPRVMLEIAGWFFNSSVPMGRLVTRDGRPPSFAGGLISFPLDLHAGSPTSQLFSGPVVLLVGVRTGSAAEGFASGLAENGRARLVGDLTCGCANIATGSVRLPDGGKLSVANIGSRSSRGLVIDGVGIAPEIAVVPDADDFRFGRDPALSAAEALLSANDNAGPLKDLGI